MKLLLLLLLSGCALFEKGEELLIEGIKHNVKSQCKEKKCPACPETELKCFVVKDGLFSTEDLCLNVIKEEKE